MELLEVDDRIREIMYDGTITQLQHHLSKVGFLSFRGAAIEKLLTGATTSEEVLRVLPRSSLTRKTAADTEVLQLVPSGSDAFAVASEKLTYS
ncbi:hypothetical protein XM38_007900 [Halomicronema hongdechloris C2206]|uniref:Uncharacterized protein n=1 Tax=Halomicronema hongdechloris C2206 TaxID=1641165 RepID=A0A1Z3HHW1_9CYAN|nr:hypothetical protein [Halomicronema hongdechloris]ASC69860.1 hypothetical protein XM38_007900 [Halomicronema hongdechloris C2206]